MRSFGTSLVPAFLTLSLVDLGCGATSVDKQVTLHGGYDAIAGVRLLMDGVTASALETFSFSYRDVEVVGRSVHARVHRVASSSIAATLAGEFDATSGYFLFAPFAFALTGTTTEEVQQLGGLGQDRSGTDGIAEDVSGFVRVRRGAAVLEGFYVASPVLAARPGEPDRSRIRVAASNTLGRATIRGDAGAFHSGAVVEIFVARLSSKEPLFEAAQALLDGSLDTEVVALVDDVVILRARANHLAGPGIAFVVQ